MSSEVQEPDQTQLKKKEEKKPQIIVKLEWIFGIRKDFLPNVEFLGKDTIIYPASNNIVIFNYLRNMGNMNLQHYIPGEAHSKGITSLIAMNFSKKVVGFSEDLQEGIKISFYHITIKQGLKNFPVPQTIYDSREEEELSQLRHTYCMAYSKSRRTNDYYIVALASDQNDYYFILWKWDLDTVRDKPIVQKIELHEPKIEEEKEPSKENGSSESVSIKEEDSGINPSNNQSKDEQNFKDEPIEVNYNNTFFKIGFQTLDNTLFSLTCKYSVVFYRITSEDIHEEYRINLVDEHGQNDYGNEIYGSSWLNDGPFCLITDHYINIFNIEIPVYGICLAAAFVICSVISYIRCVRRGMDGNNLIIIAAFVFGFALLCGGLLFMFVTYPLDEIIELIKHGDWDALMGGIVFYGGLAGGIVGAYIGSKIAMDDLRNYMDIVIPVVPLGQAIGRAGCFAAGCCFGRPTDSAIGVIYTDPMGTAPTGVSLLPVQLFESAACLIIFVILMIVSSKTVSRYLTTFLYCIMYGVTRFVLEFFRYDSIRGSAFGLSTSQWISLLMIVSACAAAVIVEGKMKRRADAES